LSADARVRELGLDLDHPAKPVANYVPAVRTGNLLFVSGQGPLQPDRTLIKGKVGEDLTAEQGYEAARVVGINILAQVKAALGSLDRVKRVVKLLGMVNADPSFEDHPRVINGCSDLMNEVFGDAGKHARSAVGMGSLPSNIAVEAEAIFEVE
jgi:enamine deaminase RidA (YjgF/YER057c/UK114 family)